MTKLEAPKILKNFKPSGTKGIVQTTVVYIGVDKIFNFLDNLEGGMIKKIGVNVPIIGRLSLLDGIEYLVVAGGAKLNMDTVIAFVATKFFNAGINYASSLGISAPQISSNSGSTQISPAVVTTGIGAPIG